MSLSADYIVVGAGSAGCIVAARLAAAEAGSVMIVEAGPSDRHPLVQMPFGLTWLMGSKRRDWAFKSAPQAALGGRQLSVPRGRMLGGSGSINSMVWFRGRREDYDGWGVPGWSWADVAPAFEAVEAELTPARLEGAHPLSERLHSLVGSNADAPPTPEYQSAGICRFNMRGGKRWSAADAYLRPAGERHALTIVTGRHVDRIAFKGGAARVLVLANGEELTALKGIVLSAGSIGSPAILIRSGIGPADHLAPLGIDLIQNAERVGANLHDHPAVGLHYAGPRSGYGLSLRQLPAWAFAPLAYAFARKGRFASPTVEACAFFNARGLAEAPDCQSHFIPFMLGWNGARVTLGEGYFADVTLCRPRSRGALRLRTADPLAPPHIDLGLLSDPSDLDTLVAGLMRLRALMEHADLGPHKAPEAFPGPNVQSEAALAEHVRARCGTAYHPVGSLEMGEGATPVTPRLAVRGVSGLWVADASVMPAVTSANTNAPSMMIGHRAADMIMEDAA